MNSSARSSTKPAPLVALAGWLVPGAGYLLLGDKLRGWTIGVTVIALFVIGVLIGGVRVIDVPGFDRTGGEVRVDGNGNRMESTFSQKSMYERGTWAVTSRGFIAEVINKPWYIPQSMFGPGNFIASWFSIGAARGGIAQAHGRLWDIGTLYTAVAGMLNLLAIIDSSHRAGGK